MAKLRLLVVLLGMSSCLMTNLDSIPSHGPPTWQTFKGVGYYVHSVPMVWAQAKDFCLKNGGTLLMPKSSEENAFAVSLLQERRATNNAWLFCLKDDPYWFCTLDGVSQRPTFTNVDRYQPTPDGNCATVAADGGKWRSTNCDSEATAVCEREVTVQRARLAMYCMTIGTNGRPVTGQCVHKP